MPEPDQPLAFQRDRVAPHERFLAAFAGDEGAVRALVNQQAAVAVDLYPRMQPRDQRPLHDDIVLLRPPQRQHLVCVFEHVLAALEREPDPLRPVSGTRAECDRRQHAGHVLLMPQHLVQLDLLALTANGGHVDLSRAGAPFGREPPDRVRGQHDLTGLGLAGHAVGGVHLRAEDVLVFEDDWAEVATDPDRDVLPWTVSAGCPPMSCCISAAALTASLAVGKIARISSPMVLITVPRLRSVEPRISSTQIKIMSRAW